MAVEVSQLTRRFGEVTALDDVCLSVRRGEFFSLLGPSGCGKTSLLRIVAGLDWPDRGSVRLGDRNALELPAHRRPVNTVFQSYALFPHLSVRGNIAFGLQMKRVPKAECARRVEEAMALARIAELAGRRPDELSGGQKQRVALARALVNEPEVLLLDEPLGALDLQLRRQLQVELKALQRRLGITFIHVTHDQEEALALSDRIAVMNAGRVEQVGAPSEVYDHPRTRFVALFLGSCNLIEASLTPPPVGAHREARTTFGPITLAPATGLPDRASVTLAIRPERIGVAQASRSGAEPRGPNRLAATVREALYAGCEMQYTVESAGQVLRVRVPTTPDGSPGWQAGERVEVYLPAAALTVLED